MVLIGDTKQTKSNGEDSGPVETGLARSYMALSFTLQLWDSGRYSAQAWNDIIAVAM